VPRSEGPIPAEVAIVSDWPDFQIRKVFDALAKLGIAKDSIFLTHILELPPTQRDDYGQPDPDEYVSERKTCPGDGWSHVSGVWQHEKLTTGFSRVSTELAEVNPKLVITLGKLPLLALTGNTSLDSWQGSRLSLPQHKFPIVPAMHPRKLSRMPGEEFIFKICLKRAFNVYTGKQVPRLYRHIVQPDFTEVVDHLTSLLAVADARREDGTDLLLSGDLETRAGHIACFGIATSAQDALCIPHLKADESDPFYWADPEEEAIIISLYGQLFQHPAIIWIGQNFSYDCQYFWRHWGVRPIRVRDTMIGHHALHSNIKKGLDFLSLLYSQDHVYWKDEIKDWDAKYGELQYWGYNCKDACITYEIDSVLTELAEERSGRATDHVRFQQSLFFPVLRMTERGLRRDSLKHAAFRNTLLQLSLERQEKLNWVVGHDLNPKSPKQLLNLFYKDFGIPGIRALGSESLSTNSPTLALIAEKDPLLAPLCQLITELRSIGVFLSTFIEAGLDVDGRMRTSFAIAGPTSYRFASRENAFGSGMNFQNIPVVTKQKIKGPDYVKLPNIRELFIPDPGHTYFDLDLDRADMQVVGRESGDRNLIEALAKGVDLHCFSASEVFGFRGIPFEELIESHPNYPEHRAKIGKANRDKCKNGGHACDYAVGDRKLAQTLGVTIKEAETFKAKWFGLFPGIHKWHRRTEELVLKQGYIENKFGARLYLFGRFNLPEFLGWTPQSTVAGVINRALVAIDSAHEAGETACELLIQVHDSLAGQFPTATKEKSLGDLRRLASITVPYDEPLVIPVGIKLSQNSWGEVK